MAKSKANPNGKQLLFILPEREALATSLRLMRVPKRLAQSGMRVDVLTQDEQFVPKLREYYEQCTNVSVITLEPESRMWTMQQRDGFAKTFIKLYQDMVIPGTDMHFWKAVAFDDFLWHVSRNVFPAIEKKYDAVWMPVPSAVERPNEKSDGLYTAVAFYCKNQGIPLVGLQVYPISDLPPMMLDVVDYWVVTEAIAQRFFIDKGVVQDRILLMDGYLDNYCISSVDDAFSTMALDDDLQSPKEVFTVSVFNHASNRSQLKEIIGVLGKIKKPFKFFFVFVGNNVREFTELNVFQDLIAPTIKKEVGDFYTVEMGGMMRAVMASDVIISTSYIVPLSFAQRYGKLGIIYNPLSEPSPYLENVEQITDANKLLQSIKSAHEAKKAQIWLEDVTRRVGV